MFEDTLDPIEAHIKGILYHIGEDVNREGLLETPSRVAKMFREIFSGLHEDPRDHLRKYFTTENDSMIIVKDIPFHSTCEHHLVTFSGVCHIGYIPAKHPDGDGYRIAGLSKFARMVLGYAKRPQVQENLTGQIADGIQGVLAPQGCIVVVEASHFCMSTRGAKVHGTTTITSAVRGLFDGNIDGVKTEFLALIK